MMEKVAEPQLHNAPQGYLQSPQRVSPPLSADDYHRQIADALQFPPNMIAETQSQTPRETWRAPGNVVIEDGLQNFPPLMGGALSRTPPLPGGAPTLQQSQNFHPQPPAEMPRSTRRMPAPEDFPAHTQRAWSSHHKSASPEFDGAQDDRKKQGFFGRLTGMGRKPSDASTGDRRALNEQQNALDPDVPMPIFFGREGRR
jgi:cell division protein FtsZ